MKGIPSYCSICGVRGYSFDCPTYFDECVDKRACRNRVARSLEAQLKKAKELEKKLLLLDKCPYSFLYEFDKWFNWQVRKIQLPKAIQ